MCPWTCMEVVCQTRSTSPTITGAPERWPSCSINMMTPRRSTELGQNYEKVFNPATGFMQGKSKDGKWRDPFRPDQEYDDYVETDAWQSSFSVPHDVNGLIESVWWRRPVYRQARRFIYSSIQRAATPARHHRHGGYAARKGERTKQSQSVFVFLRGRGIETRFWIRRWRLSTTTHRQAFQAMMIAASCRAGSFSLRWVSIRSTLPRECM